MTDDASAIEARLARLEDREVIRDLIHRYAFNIRSGHPARSVDLFTADATFETQDANPLDPSAGAVRVHLDGRDAIIAHISQSAGRGRVYPSITNVLIDLNGDRAAASCLMSARVWPGGTLVMGEYRDTFRREAGWRFEGRIYTIFSQTAP